jgi:hypothetical protein
MWQSFMPLLQLSERLSGFLATHLAGDDLRPLLQSRPETGSAGAAHHSYQGMGPPESILRLWWLLGRAIFDIASTIPHGQNLMVLV